MNLDKALSFFVSQRTSAAITGNKEHDNILTEHSKVFKKIEEDVPEVNQELNKLDELEGAVNAIVATETYKQGFEDGVRLMAKLIK